MSRKDGSKGKSRRVACPRVWVDYKDIRKGGKILWKNIPRSN